MNDFSNFEFNVEENEMVNNFNKINEGIYFGTIERVYNSTNSRGNTFINFVVVSYSNENHGAYKINVRYYWNKENKAKAYNSILQVFNSNRIDAGNNLFNHINELIGKPVLYKVSLKIGSNINRQFKDIEFVGFNYVTLKWLN